MNAKTEGLELIIAINVPYIIGPLQHKHAKIYFEMKKCGEVLCECITRLAQLGGRWSAEREVAGSNPGRTNTQGLLITEKRVLPL